MSLKCQYKKGPSVSKAYALSDIIITIQGLPLFFPLFLRFCFFFVVLGLFLFVVVYTGVCSYKKKKLLLKKMINIKKSSFLANLKANSIIYTTHFAFCDCIWHNLGGHVHTQLPHKAIVLGIKNGGFFVAFRQFPHPSPPQKEKKKI